MRFDKGHKEQTRRRIVETAASRFRKEGVAAVGIAGLMADAGLTHGGFYAHFASKEELVCAALDEAFTQTQQRRAKAMEPASGPQKLEAMVRYYLRPIHRDTPERGCAAAALVAEIARHGEDARGVLSDGLKALLNQIIEILPSTKTIEEKERSAIGIFGVMLGTLQLARAVADPTMSDNILESGITAALKLADMT